MEHQWTAAKNISGKNQSTLDFNQIERVVAMPKIRITSRNLALPSAHPAGHLCNLRRDYFVNSHASQHKDELCQGSSLGVPTLHWRQKRGKGSPEDLAHYHDREPGSKRWPEHLRPKTVEPRVPIAGNHLDRQAWAPTVWNMVVALDTGAIPKILNEVQQLKMWSFIWS